MPPPGRGYGYVSWSLGLSYRRDSDDHMTALEGQIRDRVSWVSYNACSCLRGI